MLTPADILAALKERWTLGALVAVLLFVIFTAFAAMQPRIYDASASIVFDIAKQDPTLLDNDNSDSSVVGTLMDVMQSRRVATAVARNMVSEDNQRDVDDTAQWLLSTISVSGGRNSNVVVVTARSQDPETAARVANSFATSYLEILPYMQAEAARNFAAWLELQTTSARERLEQAQRELEAFQKQSDELGAGGLDLQAESLRSLNAELSRAESETASASAVARAQNYSRNGEPEVIRELRGQVALQRSRVAELSKTLGPNHPDMQAAKAQEQALARELANAIEQEKRALRAAEEAAQTLEAEIKSRMASRQSQLIEMSPVQARYDVLQNEVETAQREYDAVRERLGEQFLLSRASQANASLLDEARVPTLPVEPNMPVLLMLGFIFSAMAGVTIVVLFEVLNPRVRTSDGLERITGIPVIADISSSARSYAARRKFGMG